MIRNSLPILTFHSLDSADAPTSTTPSRFADIVARLIEAGFVGVDLAEWIARGRPAVAGGFAITFDDGLRSILPGDRGPPGPRRAGHRLPRHRPRGPRQRLAGPAVVGAPVADARLVRGRRAVAAGHHVRVAFANASPARPGRDRDRRARAAGFERRDRREARRAVPAVRPPLRGLDAGRAGPLPAVRRGVRHEAGPGVVLATTPSICRGSTPATSARTACSTGSSRGGSPRGWRPVRRCARPATPRRRSPPSASGDGGPGASARTGGSCLPGVPGAGRGRDVPGMRAVLSPRRAPARLPPRIRPLPRPRRRARQGRTARRDRRDDRPRRRGPRLLRDHPRRRPAPLRPLPGPHPRRRGARPRGRGLARRRSRPDPRGRLRVGAACSSRPRQTGDWRSRASTSPRGGWSWRGVGSTIAG